MENSAPDFPNSRKVYANGTLHPDIRVPMREISLSPTKVSADKEEVNPAVWVYDTSGPYTDPSVQIDIRKGLSPLRQSWIQKRGDTEALSGQTSSYGRARQA